MATIEKVGNILLVYGLDVYNKDSDYRGILRDILYSNSAPVTKGTHDFWFVYSTPSLDDPNHSYEDMGVSPRPMRGIISMADIPTDTKEETLQDHLSVLLQESGHHWSVTPNLKFEIDGKETGMITAEESVNTVFNDLDFSGIPLLGRDNKHWSSYLQGDNSPFDGVFYENMDNKEGYNLWKATTDFPGNKIIVSDGNLPEINLSGKWGAYNDLDLVTMGVKDPRNAYANYNNSFYWIEPRLTFPLGYLAGIFVSFDVNDYIYFGFYRDHTRLAVMRTGSSILNEISLGDDYEIFDEYNGMALRVVKKGNDYHFQTGRDNPLAGCAGPFQKFLAAVAGSRYSGSRRAPHMFEDLIDFTPQTPNTNSLDDFNTIAKISESRTPISIGLIVKTFSGDLVEAAFRNTEVRWSPYSWKNGSETSYTDAGNSVLEKNKLPPVFQSGRDVLMPNKWYVHSPEVGPKILSEGGRLLITTKFGKAYDHNGTVDNAPKIITQAPKEDFAFGTWSKLRRSVFVPWSGGGANEKSIWGKQKSALVANVIMPDEIKRKWTPPDENTFKIAFIIVAKGRQDINDEAIYRLDKIRKYWDQTFYIGTGEKRKSNSNL